MIKAVESKRWNLGISKSEAFSNDLPHQGFGGLGFGFTGFIGFTGFTGFIGFMGFIGFIGFMGFIGLWGL